MPAGKLDRRIVVERYTTVQDQFGEEVEAWAHFSTIWASKKDVKDQERIAAAEISAEITTRFVIRWSVKSATINPKDRIIYNFVTYNIFGVKEIGRHKMLEITAAARADGDG